MQDYDRPSYATTFAVVILALAVIGVLAFGAWTMRDQVIGGTEPVEPIYDACIESYGDNACRCFSGVMSVQLSPYRYQTYTRSLEADVRRRYFDNGLAQRTLSGRDLRVCIDASDICGVSVCEAPRTGWVDQDYAPGSAEPVFGADEWEGRP